MKFHTEKPGLHIQADLCIYFKFKSAVGWIRVEHDPKLFDLPGGFEFECPVCELKAREKPTIQTLSLDTLSGQWKNVKQVKMRAQAFKMSTGDTICFRVGQCSDCTVIFWSHYLV